MRRLIEKLENVSSAADPDQQIAFFDSMVNRSLAMRRDLEGAMANDAKNAGLPEMRKDLISASASLKRIQVECQRRAVSAKTAKEFRGPRGASYTDAYTRGN